MCHEELDHSCNEQMQSSEIVLLSPRGNFTALAGGRGVRSRKIHTCTIPGNVVVLVATYRCQVHNKSAKSHGGHRSKEAARRRFHFAELSLMKCRRLLLLL
jgi:hypothetical protein